MAVSITNKATPTVDSDEVTLLLGRAKAIKDKIDAQQELLKATYQELANKTCPYKVGDKVVTKKGLGQQGLIVQAITPPNFPNTNNLWAIDTFALSKAGELTRRAVRLEHWSMTMDGDLPK